VAGVLQRLCLPAMANTSTVGQEPVEEAADIPDRRARLAVLLPLDDAVQASAAQAVAAGVLAAHAYAGLHLTVNVISTQDTPEALLRAYRAASAEYDLVIGALSRKAVEVIVRQGSVIRPTIALAHPEDVRQPAHARAGILMMGLPVEEEARYLAHWMQENATDGYALALYTDVVWQQRAAQAWMVQAKKLGLRVAGLKLPQTGYVLQQTALQAAYRKMGADLPAQLFCALDVHQTEQIRTLFGMEMPVYGTSHLNPFIVDRNYGQTYPLLEGVRLLDIPWQLPGSSVVVQRYPPPQGYFGARPTVNQRRLYALGIDAYRIAQELAQGRNGFDLDGVTGKLTVAMHTGGVTYFQRQYLRAEFRHGSVVPVKQQY
jgi:outer membrane PBP1 activator LpoA protein